MKKLVETVIAISIILLLATVTQMAQDKMEDTSAKSCCSPSDKDSSCCMDKEKSHDMKSMSAKKMDKNLDGKLYQCPMCADQIKDEAGKCAKCEMNLKEVSVEDANKAMAKKGHDMMDHDKMHEHNIDHAKMLDKNKDGKVYQCPMCADQMKDEAGKCAKCEMNLKEVSIDDAQKALSKSSKEMMGHDKMDHSKMMKHDKSDSSKHHMMKKK